jgi:cytochrome c oxidase subunit 2
MRLRVVAHSPDDFQHWLQAQRAKAQEPQTARQKAGEQVFMSSACVACHKVRGTLALGQVGPDLTHVASRRYIAGGMLPNNRANLQAWITHAQSLKPGSQMPDITAFNGEQLNALADYLQSLK